MGLIASRKIGPDIYISVGPSTIQRQEYELTRKLGQTCLVTAENVLHVGLKEPDCRVGEIKTGVFIYPSFARPHFEPKKGQNLTSKSPLVSRRRWGFCRLKIRLRKPRGAFRLICFFWETLVDSAILSLRHQSPQLPRYSLHRTEALVGRENENNQPGPSVASSGPRAEPEHLNPPPNARARRSIVTSAPGRPRPRRRRRG